MRDAAGALADRLRAEGEGVLAFYQNLPLEQWNRTLYADGTAWRIQEILAHFIAAENVFQELIQNIANRGPGASQDFNMDDYNRRTVGELRRAHPEVLLGQFALARERTVALVRKLSPEQLQQEGRHPALGTVSLSRMIKSIYGHTNEHLRDVRQALRAAQPGSGLETGMV